MPFSGRFFLLALTKTLRDKPSRVALSLTDGVGQSTTSLSTLTDHSRGDGASLLIQRHAILTSSSDGVGHSTASLLTPTDHSEGGRASPFERPRPSGCLFP